jgi:hypothetical protein
MHLGRFSDGGENNANLVEPNSLMKPVASLFLAGPRGPAASQRQSMKVQPCIDLQSSWDGYITGEL